MLIQNLEQNNLDIIGDVHGEISALNNLLEHLGYDGDGIHPQGRILVFVGDLMDRGENSWAVYKKVSHLIEQGNAHCILGNHELNLLIPDPEFTDGRPKVKAGNEWFHGQIELVNKEQPTSVQPQYLLHTAEEREELTQFLETLPLAIETPKLRIVHACWDKESIKKIRQSSLSVAKLHEKYERSCHQKIDTLVKEYLREHPTENPNNLSSKDWFKQQHRKHPMRIQAELIEQNDNLIKRVSSGPEDRLRNGQQPYEAGKKKRYVQRARWWEDYTDDKIVVVGHYWRKAEHPQGTIDLTPEDKRHIPSTFQPHEGSFHWLGVSETERRNVMCVDYSVGKRFLERHHKVNTGTSGSYLGAFRYTENDRQGSIEIVLDDGRVIPIQS